MNTLTTRLLTAALLLASSLTLADGMQPGLWEVRHTTLVDGKPLPTLNEMMADVPPEMRAQMQGMMAAQGVGMAAEAIRICISPEQAARRDMPPADAQPDCRFDTTQKGPRHWSYRMTCQDPPSSGEGETELLSDTQWKSSMQMQRQERGRTQRMETRSEGRWVGKDCGNVRPQR